MVTLLNKIWRFLFSCSYHNKMSAPVNSIILQKVIELRSGICYNVFFLLSLLFTADLTQAQLCQGSLGDPIINTTFGAGTNPGPSLSSATTNYQYVSTDCPSDGYYTVRNNTTNCFGNTWFSLNSDHTGDAGGYFMLVNASIQPSAFYLDTVRGLCTNTTFEFAAWVINVNTPSACGGNPILPDLTFRIEKTDGTLLQSYNTNGIPLSAVPAWKQYGFFFTTPVGIADVVLRIINNASGGCGNDLALDDITFRACGPVLTPFVTGWPSNNISFCKGIANIFQFNCTVSGGFNNPVYQWQQNINNTGWTDLPGETNITLSAAFNTNAAPGTYNYRLAVTEAGNINSVTCRVFSSVISVLINALPVTSASGNSPVCEGRSLQLNATGGTQYDWTGPGGFSANIANPVINNIQPVNAGKYYVLVKNTAGCQKTDSTSILINPSPVAITAFSDTSICAGNNVTLSGNGGTTWLWSPPTGLSATSISNPVASPADSILYIFIAGNLFGCTDTAFTKVNVIKIPLVDAGSDRTIIGGNSIRLTGQITGNYNSFFWSPSQYISNTQILQPLVNPPVDIDYILNVQSPNSCGVVTDTMHIRVLAEIYIPNAFTPDGNGLNDTWNIPALAAYDNFELIVMNRFGELVFKTRINKPWDGKYKGKDLSAGTYTYVLDLKNGLNLIKGTVILIR